MEDIKKDVYAYIYQQVSNFRRPEGQYHNNK